MMSLIIRYNTAATNGFYKALRELQRLQALRKKNQPVEVEVEPQEIGFVSQTIEDSTPLTPKPAPKLQPELELCQEEPQEIAA